MTDPGTEDAGGRSDAAVERLVVVGASLAGLRAVETARKLGFSGEITLIGDEPHLPYNRPALSKTVLETAGCSARGIDLLHPSDTGHRLR